uniref:Uncharacterized protein n=1 Tax=Oryza sativa subsp. japonica TaxID=39947 RepID=Q6Z3R8_ORYSJ|nr:hypothetical protein [Oryza sativa Japonica Group]
MDRDDEWLRRALAAFGGGGGGVWELVDAALACAVHDRPDELIRRYRGAALRRRWRRLQQLSPATRHLILVFLLGLAMDRLLGGCDGGIVARVRIWLRDGEHHGGHRCRLDGHLGHRLLLVAMESLPTEVDAAEPVRVPPVEAAAGAPRQTATAAPPVTILQSFVAQSAEHKTELDHAKQRNEPPVSQIKQAHEQPYNTIL